MPPEKFFPEEEAARFKPARSVTCERQRKELAEYGAAVERWKQFIKREPDGYIPVPVEAAKQIAQHCHKEIVVVLAYDATFQKTHTTTYGYSPAAKDIAAQWGEQCAAAVGADLQKSRIFEDFRATTEAENRRQVEDLANRVKELESAIKWALGDDAAITGPGMTGSFYNDEAIYPHKVDGQVPRYWWRDKLREKAGL